MSGAVRAAILREWGYFSGRITADARPGRSRMEHCPSQINEKGIYLAFRGSPLMCGHRTLAFRCAFKRPFYQDVHFWNFGQ
jgi:hypothetical protein